MTTRLALTLALICAPVAATAQSMQLSCAGNRPDWTLSLTGDTAEFTFGRVISMTIPQRTTAEDRDWPKALTLLGGRETAIVILNQRSCSTSTITNYPVEATILTQRGETPVILAGCCTPRP